MKNVPKLRFKEFSGEWEEKKLGDICEIIMGQSPSSSCYNENNIGLPLIQGKADIKDRKTLPRIYTSDITKICDVGDIIMSVRAPVGYISKSSQKSCIGRGVCGIKAKQNREFIYQFLIGYEDKWDKISQGSTFESINRNDIDNTKISIPSLQEQEKIAFFLSLIDDKINLQSEKVKYLKDYKKGLMQKIFSRELRFKDENGNDYPEWEEKKLGEICTLKKGEQLNKEVLINTGIYYVLNGGIEPSGYTDKYNTKSNTISISEGGNSCGYVNYNFKKFWSGGHCYTLENISNIIINRYLYHFLKFKQKYIMNLRVGTGLPNIQKKDLILLKVDIPCLDEQLKIANLLSSLDEKIEKEQEKLNSLKEYKKGLLQKMFV